MERHAFVGSKYLRLCAICGREKNDYEYHLSSADYSDKDLRAAIEAEDKRRLSAQYKELLGHANGENMSLRARVRELEDENAKLRARVRELERLLNIEQSNHSREHQDRLKDLQRLQLICKCDVCHICEFHDKGFQP